MSMFTSQYYLKSASQEQMIRSLSILALCCLLYTLHNIISIEHKIVPIMKLNQYFFSIIFYIFIGLNKKQNFF